MGDWGKCCNFIEFFRNYFKFREMGGFFGTKLKNRECRAELFYGTDYQSHLGTRRAGMVTISDEGEFFRSIHSLEQTYFRTKFEHELDKFKGRSGIGVISDTDAQPLLIHSHLGRFALVTVAKINNLEELAQQLLAENMHLSEFSSGRINPTELVSLLIIKGKDFVEGIENVFNSIKGSCSMLLLTEDGIIAARDRWGRTPIVVGKSDDGMAVTSESTAFPNLGFETVHYVGPGEIVRITADEMIQMRNECGRAMGETDDVEVDCVCGIPDSGIGMAVGYAEGHKVPYMRAIAKYTPTWPRSFMPSNQSMRNLVAKMKLIQNTDMLKGKRWCFCDDSIVRGTQLRDTAAELINEGAKEVHMRIACPPLIYACPFVNFSASKSELELITRRIIQDFEGDMNKNVEAYAITGSPEYQRMVDEIARRLKLSSLKFSTVETIVKAIGLPKCKVCTHCFDGSSFHTLK